jgi:hypothetical protein
MLLFVQLGFSRWPDLMKSHFYMLIDGCTGLDLEDLMKKLASLQIKFTFGKLTDDTDAMTAIMQSALKDTPVRFLHYY